MMMKQIFAALAIGAAAFAAQAADMSANGDAKTAATAQQSKMTTCNKEATGKKGDDRKAFMKECLSAKGAPSQQNKMTMCNKEATGKAGADRKAFMKDCLSNKPKA